MNTEFCRMVGQFLVSEDAKHDRWVTRDRVMFWLVVFFIVAPLIYAAKAWAAPKAQGPQECVLYADMSLVVAANAKNGIPRASTIKTLPDIYRLTTPESREIARLIVIWLYDKTDPSTIDANALASGFAEECMKRGGDMDRFLVGVGA